MASSPPHSEPRRPSTRPAFLAHTTQQRNAPSRPVWGASFAPHEENLAVEVNFSAASGLSTSSSSAPSLPLSVSYPNLNLGLIGNSESGPIRLQVALTDEQMEQIAFAVQQRRATEVQTVSRQKPPPSSPSDRSESPVHTPPRETAPPRKDTLIRSSSPVDKSRCLLDQSPDVFRPRRDKPVEDSPSRMLAPPIPPVHMQSSFSTPPQKYQRSEGSYGDNFTHTMSPSPRALYTIPETEDEYGPAPSHPPTHERQAKKEALKKTSPFVVDSSSPLVTLAQRRLRNPPSRLDLPGSDTIKQAAVQKYQPVHTIDPKSPIESLAADLQEPDDDHSDSPILRKMRASVASSRYSQDFTSSAKVSPLHPSHYIAAAHQTLKALGPPDTEQLLIDLQRDASHEDEYADESFLTYQQQEHHQDHETEEPQYQDTSILQGYTAWKESQEKGESQAAPAEAPAVPKSEATKKQDKKTGLTVPMMDKALPFTPLTPYFNTGGDAPKKKVLIGDEGWVETSFSQGSFKKEQTPPMPIPVVVTSEAAEGVKTNKEVKTNYREVKTDYREAKANDIEAEMNNKEAEMERIVEGAADKGDKGEKEKKKGFLGGLRKIVRGVHDNFSTPKHPVDRSKHYSSMNISLDPREQSLLYCELEYHLTSAVHGYITTQFNHGRLDANKLKRVADAWVSKGRPRVVGFRYDLDTQLELVALHDAEFRFYGRRQGSLLEIGALLYAMRINARAMQVRSFCQPDSVIAKQLVDSQSLFNMMGVPELQQAALFQIGQFFRVIVERESRKRKEAERTGMQTPMVGPGPAGQFPVGGEVRSDMPAIYGAYE